VLEKGGKSVYQPLARASTIVPSSVGGYLRQQWRWNRSFYRQFRWILPVLRGNLNLYLMLDFVARSCPPMLLALALLWAAWDLVTAGAQPATDLLAVTTMTLISLSLVLWQTRKPGFVLLYGLLYLLLLIPTRLWALCTLGDSRWGSRTLVANSEWQSSSSRNRRHPGTAQRNRLAS
jgi:hypothetical protein